MDCFKVPFKTALLSKCCPTDIAFKRFLIWMHSFLMCFKPSLLSKFWRTNIAFIGFQFFMHCFLMFTIQSKFHLTYFAFKRPQIFRYALHVYAKSLVGNKRIWANQVINRFLFLLAILFFFSIVEAQISRYFFVNSYSFNIKI